MHSFMLRPNDTVIVSSYYPLTKGISKYSTSHYIGWMKNLLSIVNARVVIYTSSSMEDFFRKVYLTRLPKLHESEVVLRNVTTISTLEDYNSTKGKSMINASMIIITCFNDPYELPPIQPYLQSIKDTQQALDPERSSHRPPLYALWNSKVWMLHEALALFSKTGALYFWLDVGNYRMPSSNIVAWPDPVKLHKLPIKDLRAKEMLQLLYKEPNHFYPLFKPESRNITLEGSIFDYGRHHSDCIMGCFFGGRPPGIKWYNEIYYKKLEAWYNEGLFIGKEQNLFDAIAMTNADSIKVIDLSSLSGGPKAAAKRYSFLYHYLGKTRRKDREFSVSSFSNGHPILPFSKFQQDAT